MIDREALVAELIARFPNLEEDITDEAWVGLLHLEVGCFTRYTRELIDAGDKKELDACFECARRFLAEGDAEVKNAICRSYLAKLNFNDGKRKRTWARDRLPPSLREAVERIAAYDRRLLE